MTIALGRSHAPTAPDAMTLVEHLGELHRRVLICMGTVAVMGTVAFVLYGPILSVLQAPYGHVSPSHCNRYVTGPPDGQTRWVKMAAYGGLVLASPVLLWELWRFITPGLRAKGKRYAVLSVIASVVLFGSGGTVAIITFPHALAWLGSIGGPSLSQILDPTNYLSLIILLMVAFGATFEFPVLLVSLEGPGSSGPSSWLRGDDGRSSPSWWWPVW